MSWLSRLLGDPDSGQASNPAPKSHIEQVNGWMEREDNLLAPYVRNPRLLEPLVKVDYSWKHPQLINIFYQDPRLPGSGIEARGHLDYFTDNGEEVMATLDAMGMDRHWMFEYHTPSPAVYTANKVTIYQLQGGWLRKPYHTIWFGATDLDIYPQFHVQQDLTGKYGHNTARTVLTLTAHT